MPKEHPPCHVGLRIGASLRMGSPVFFRPRRSTDMMRVEATSGIKSHSLACPPASRTLRLGLVRGIMLACVPSPRSCTSTPLALPLPPSGPRLSEESVWWAATSAGVIIR